MSSVFDNEVQQLISSLQSGPLGPDTFPERAMEAVRARDFSSFKREDILPYLAKDLPHQFYAANAFGRFNLTIHWQKEFSIQIYFMDDISTEIHSHNFFGYYQYLEGTSLQMKFRELPVPQTGLQANAFELINEQIDKTGAGQLVVPGYLHQVMRMEKKNTVLMCMHHHLTPVVDRYYLPTGHALFNPPVISDKFLRMTYLLSIEPQFNQHLLDMISPEEALVYLFRHHYLDKNVPEVLGDLLKHKINTLISFDELRESFKKMAIKEKKLSFLA